MRSRYLSWLRVDIVFALGLAALILTGGRAFAQSVAIAANHSPEAASLTARAAATRPIDIHIILALHDEAVLDKLLDELHNPASPNFHHWLTPAEFNRRFGPRQADFDTVIDWLRSQGVAVTAADRESRYIDFTLPAAEAEHLFNVTIAASADGRSYANLVDPSIPARFAGVIAAVDGLDNLRRAHPLISRIPSQLIFGASGTPYYLYKNGLAFGPGDINTFYDNSGALDGTGQTIAIVEDSDWLGAAVTTFDDQFGLPTAPPTKLLPDGSNPGINGDETEALLDVEWAHAIAPQAALKVYISDPKHPKIGDIVDSIMQAVADPTVAVLSISFDFCGSSPLFFSKTLDGFFKQAETAGISVFVSSGDSGVDTCHNGTQNVSEMAADWHVAGVGGTMFSPNYNVQGNDVGSVPEQVWKVGTEHPPGGASGGGASAIFAKPNFQMGGLTPNDGHRDVPDVAMIAGEPGVYLGDDNMGSGVIDCCEGGTSLAAPLFAGIFALIDQNQGRVGNPDYGFYQLGPSENSSSIGLRDVTSGDNGFNGVPGFSAGPLYDQVTGWGTPDIDQLVAAWKTVKPPPVPVTLGVAPKKLSLGKAIFGVTGATTKAQVMTVSNPGGANGQLVNFTSITADHPEFSLSEAIPNGCGASLAPAKSCKVSVTYTPSAQTAQGGNLVIKDNTVAGETMVPLGGIGIAGAITFKPTKLKFPKQMHGTTSASMPITATNPNPVDLMITNVAVTGDFIKFSDGCTGVLKSKTSGMNTCQVGVEFKPTTTGLRKGTVVFTDDALKGSQSVGLSGTGN